MNSNNVGKLLIKSVISQDKSKYYVFNINNDNIWNYLIYYINKKKWNSNYIIYLNVC